MKGNNPMASKELREQAEALDIEIDGRWSNATLRRKVDEAQRIHDEEEARNTKPSEQLVAVRLLKHHKPARYYEVLGHYNDNEEFISGEPRPAPFPGVSQSHKLWAGTVAKLPAEDAKRLVENLEVLMVTDRDENNRAIGKREVRQRKPLAERYTDWGEVGATGMIDARGTDAVA